MKLSEIFQNLFIYDTHHQKYQQKTPISRIYSNILRGDSGKSLKGSLLILNFDVLPAATNSRYANCNDIRLVNFGPIA